MISPSDTGRAGHTMTPWVLGVDQGDWRVDHDSLPSTAAWAIGTSDGEHPIAFAVTAGHYDDPEFIANAELIVRAVNAHDDLIATLRDAREFVQMNVDELLASCCVTGDDGKPDRSTIDHMDKSAIDDAEGCLARIDAALALAEGDGK